MNEPSYHKKHLSIFFYYKIVKNVIKRYSLLPTQMGVSLCSRKIKLSPMCLTHGGEANSDRCLFANVLKQLGFAVACDVMGHLQVAKRPCRVEKNKI